MAKLSAGLLLYDEGRTGLRVLLVHPGGPLWARRDLGAWSIPKGEYLEGEDPREVAAREFEEETGARPEGEFIPLGEALQPSRKRVTVFALAGAFDVGALTSNAFEMEWPPHSGQRRSFPEVDRAEWFPVAEARRRILPGQSVFIERLVERLAHPAG